MPRVLPSDVVHTIEAEFPWVLSPDSTAAHQPGAATPQYANQLAGPSIAAICETIDQVPEELLQFSSDNYRDFLRAVAQIRHLASVYATGAHTERPWPWVRKRNALVFLRELLKNCPDEGPAASTVGLAFIDDEELRRSVRLDISSSEAALRDGHWKAGTVLAGSALEALLLWSVVQDADAQRKLAFNNAKTELNLREEPNNWTLAPLIEIARKLDDITEPTAAQSRLAKDFRNLIHPGRENRKKMRCDRGTAHAAFAALNLAIVDLERRWRPLSTQS